MRDPIGGIDYVHARLEEALATDARVTEGGLHVAVDGAELVISGSVSTSAARCSHDRRNRGGRRILRVPERDVR